MPSNMPFGMCDSNTEDDFFDYEYADDSSKESDSNEKTSFFEDVYGGGKSILDSITGATGIDIAKAAKDAANKKLQEQTANLLNGKGGNSNNSNPVNQDTGSNTPAKSISDYATHPVTLGGATIVAVKYLAKQSWLISVSAGVAVGGAKFYIDSKKSNK